MGFLGNLVYVAPPTKTDNVEDRKESPDVEKTAVERDVTNANGHHTYPNVEKRVISKLDWHVVPLVSALCSRALAQSVWLVLI